MTTTAQAGAATTAPAAGPKPDIDHGTARGYRQHRARRVPYCEPCRAAIRKENQAARERKRANSGQQAWNKGRVGQSTTPPPRPVGRDCPAIGSGCGELATVPQPAAHMVIVAVDGSREPSRWYCAGACAAYGQALGEVRAIGGAE